jgi:hypothetical protein
MRDARDWRRDFLAWPAAKVPLHEPIGHYVDDIVIQWGRPGVEVLFGPRHTDGSSRHRALEGSIEEGADLRAFPRSYLLLATR